MQDVTPFFLWGTAQSGKSWLKQLLCGHVAIAGLDEPHITDILIPNFKLCLEHYNGNYSKKQE